jgi:hypothetical protein
VPAAAPAPAPTLIPSVVSVVSDLPDRPGEGGLGDHITVTVENLPVLLQRVGGDCGQLALFLDGAHMGDLYPERCDPIDGHVGFYLERTETNDRAWHSLLGRPRGFTRPIVVTVGPSADRSLPTKATLRLVNVPRLGFYLFLVVFGITLVLFFRLATRSELLRNPNANPQPGQRSPFSLSRVQMAFWTLLVVAAYFFLWLVTGELDTITDSVLALLSIGSGTALGATLIDAGKRDTLEKERRRLKGEETILQTTIESQGAAGAAGAAASDPLATQRARLAEVQELLSKEPESVRRSSTGSFLRDVLSDAQGISIQRFQMFVWTLILGLIFCASVYKSLDMPEFSPTLLALLGISNGTYLGFKFPEKYQPPAAGEGNDSAT